VDAVTAGEDEAGATGDVRSPDGRPGGSVTGDGAEVGLG
jgi:hypothetical protein